MARLKKISEEERQAKQDLKKMGISDYELDRLYDANYKAKQRAQAQGATPNKTLNLSWVQVKRSVTQAVAQGKTASEAIQARRQSLAKTYKTSAVKKEVGQRISAPSVDESGQVMGGSWSQEAIDRTVAKTSGDELARAENEAIKDLDESGVLDRSIKSDVYRDTHTLYEITGSSTQEEWDRLLANEYAKRDEEFNKIKSLTLEKLGLGEDVLQAIEDAQSDAEAVAESMFDLTTQQGRKSAKKYLSEKKEAVFNEFNI